MALLSSAISSLGFVKAMSTILNLNRDRHLRMAALVAKCAEI